MKRIFPLLLALAAAIFFVISLIFIEKEEQDPLLHAADIQNDISYEGKRASVLIKVPFYANTAAVTYNSGTDEYVFFPVWDCSEKDSSFVLLGYRADVVGFLPKLRTDDHARKIQNDECNELPQSRHKAEGEFAGQDENCADFRADCNDPKNDGTDAKAGAVAYGLCSLNLFAGGRFTARCSDKIMSFLFSHEFHSYFMYICYL